DRLTSLVEKLEPGDRVKIGLFRNDDRLVFYAFLGERQSTADNSSVLQVSGTSDSDQEWGIVISELVAPIRTSYNIPQDENGVIVLMVIPGSPADRAGIRKGDLIRNINQTKIYHMSDFFQALQTSDTKMVLNVFRQGYDLMIVVTATASINDVQSPGYVVAQEGIGMNRPLYVPGYDQTQSGEPDDKTNNSVTF
ncbi:magnetosome protein MamE-Cter, greigite-specific, partial [Candidatus Magnetomorum sp. HK-1]